MFTFLCFILIQVWRLGGRVTTFARAAELDDFEEIAPPSPPSVFICYKYIFEFCFLNFE